MKPEDIKKLEESLDSALNGTRLLVFLEEEPLSNKYRQITLTPKEFKKVSLSIGKVVGKQENGKDLVEVQYSNELYDLPDLPEMYPHT